MIFGLFRRGLFDRPARRQADALYGAIVAASRRPSFYLALGVPDTLEGRFDLIVLHVGLVFRRLAREGEAGRALGQEVFDMFCADMDANLREMGVGDLAVPKRMRGFAEAFYGRLGVYDKALAGDDEAALSEALARNVFGRAEAGEGARRLATYVRATVRALDAHDTAALAAGRVAFPDPETAGAATVLSNEPSP